MRNKFIFFAIFSLALVIVAGLKFPSVHWILVWLIPLVLLGLYDMFQKKHAIMRNFPVLGRFRYILEGMGPKVYQYFVESETDGRPINRMLRSVVYQRAKLQTDSEPFGTQRDVYEEGYEWLNHSIMALDAHKLNNDPRVTIGNKDCKQPYSCSILNISAMSYGSLGSRAISSLNGGAKIGKFAHNTGEGGISPYHLEHGGDLIWQIGTGYFGCRDKEGNFDAELFKTNAAQESVKMIEIKLSQGAKPGHGGILPGSKVTKEIAKIRNVEVGKTVYSPPSHTAFTSLDGLIDFIQKLKDLSGGKPVGFKLCVGQHDEFEDLCSIMRERDIYPDYIAVDGGEGGTGAAPLEFTNSIGTPYKEGLAFVFNTLKHNNIKKHVKIIASGKIITGFHMAIALALGADACYSARAMMLALGCIQALECNKNTCPTGVATHKMEFQRGLVVADKKVRVANFHRETVEAFVELLAATGMKESSELKRKHIFRRVSMSHIMTYEELYPYA